MLLSLLVLVWSLYYGNTGISYSTIRRGTLSDSTKRPPSTNKATNGRGRIKIDLGPGDKNRHTLINNRNKSIKNSIRLWRFRSRLPVSGEEGNEFVFIRFIRMKIKRSTVCYPHPFVFLLNRLIIRYLRPYPAFMSLMSDCRSASGKGPQKEGRADEYTGTVNKLALADRPPSLQLSVDVLLALADGSKWLRCLQQSYLPPMPQQNYDTIFFLLIPKQNDGCTQDWGKEGGGRCRLGEGRKNGGT